MNDNDTDPLPASKPGVVLAHEINRRGFREFCLRSGTYSLWDLHGISLRTLASRTWKSAQEDRLLDRSAELGFYFFFALFPALFSASSILGLAAKSADLIYDRLLNYLALVIPSSALGTVLDTFNETTAASTPGKITFGLIVAIWSAAIGISAVQDTLNVVCGVRETRSYFVARLYAIRLTIILSAIITLVLTCLFGGDFVARMVYPHADGHLMPMVVSVMARLIGWGIAIILLSLSFAVTYYWAPDIKNRKWRWFTPGAMIGILGWFLASLGLRLYLHYFNTYSITYGSLGVVIILLTWFYITGLMLLLGAEINNELEIAEAVCNASASSL
ncbi:YihY/virulence factor BrkB family protein [Acidicapsa ligni]|uniref:YihY/virulence factor BrkB family protein n=1 Tax=Acidicapsa ligni TaxID=542300 RepID=UPI0021E0B376|nr:YihY/virulence factor BrkB family protein [Acidicapsa ligni]